jgi:hypothetical protein
VNFFVIVVDRRYDEGGGSLKIGNGVTCAFGITLHMGEGKQRGKKDNEKKTLL